MVSRTQRENKKINAFDKRNKTKTKLTTTTKKQKRDLNPEK